MPDAVDGRDRILLLQFLPNFVTLLGLCAGLTALRLAYADRSSRRRRSSSSPR